VSRKPKAAAPERCPSLAISSDLRGFVTEEGKAMGRPVGVALDARGALLVADDVGNTIWRVSPR
jgi:glucose/arabinose dehydrogenase